VQVKTALENLRNDGRITSTELEALTETFADIERYLREKDKEVDTEVTNMGDENYIPWSERIRNEVRVEMKKQLADKDEQLADKDEQLADKDEQLADKDEQLADKDERIRELERQLEELKGKGC
jgi:chromosome segregation ATPase